MISLSLSTYLHSLSRYEIMLHCWQDESSRRPTFAELRSTFDTMLAEDNPYIQFDTINVHKPYYQRGTDSESDGAKTEQLSTSSEERSSTDSFIPSSTTSVEGAASAYMYDTLSPVVNSSVDNGFDDSPKRPIPNAYVDTPSKPYDSMFHLETASVDYTVDTDVESCCSTPSEATSVRETTV